MIDAPPYCEVFVRQGTYRAGKSYDLGPDHGYPRLRQEVAWWVWTCWDEGLMKIPVWVLRWWSEAITALAGSSTLQGPAARFSCSQIHHALVVREAIKQFYARNGKMPAPGSVRNLEGLARHIHLMVSVRCGTRQWWEHDVWDLRVDDRIPRRPHEPSGYKTIDLGAVEPAWLREGMRYWLRQNLTTQMYRWTTAVGHARQLSTYFGPWLTHTGRDLTAGPVIATETGQLRLAFLEFLSWLQDPSAPGRKGPIASNQVHTAQSRIQAFYRFMLDHADEAAAATGESRWTGLTEAHARLWSPEYTRSRRSRRRDARPEQWISAEDLATMVSVIDILASPTDQSITVTPPGRDPITASGLGDPSAARAWLLQAMTGRRVSEILMLDFDPLVTIPGVDADQAKDEDFIARLRYQQTKVDGVDPHILVDKAAVTLIRDQQAWVRERLGREVEPAYLFPELRRNFKGLRHRPYPSHKHALERLDEAVGLLDHDGAPLRFTQTHRLRHTRATELLNAGVPVHVVQRYLGHKSPEMTMAYAATLAQTAESEFLKARRAGSFGTPLTLDAQDLYEISELSGRTDRILPNGTCLLPPTRRCDKGNACLTCGHFATDTSHLPELRRQHRQTLELIDLRQEAFTQRHGTPMPENNVWLEQRHREIRSLEAIFDALEDTTETVTGAGTTARTNPYTDEPA
ncbi:tyrosine-type recombinase/integrase [Kytococcus schroeteri]|uniref:tyrosine-type recombinase/integrase n=1 Tax=Kytococcus schroeteri TaxID=138300 RepID=UPI0035EF7050